MYYNYNNLKIKGLEMKDVLELVGVIVLAVFGFISTVCSAVVQKFTPHVTAVIIVLELLDVTNYGVWSVLGYGVLTYVVAWVIIGMNVLALAIFASK